MKKLFLVFLVLIVCVSMSSCSDDKEAFEMSKTIYNDINNVHKMTENFGNDVYEVWRTVENDKDELLDDGIDYLTSKFSFNEEEVKKGIDYAMGIMLGEEWDAFSEEDKKILIEETNGVFIIMEKDLSKLCMLIVINIYTENGTITQIQTNLDHSQMLLNELNKKYENYKYYSDLEEYYSTVYSLLEFYLKPADSLEQAEATITGYNDKINNCLNNLELVFEG